MHDAALGKRGKRLTGALVAAALGLGGLGVLAATPAVAAPAPVVSDAPPAPPATPAPQPRETTPQLDHTGIMAIADRTFEQTPGDAGDRMQAAVDAAAEIAGHPVAFYRGDLQVTITAADVLHTWTITDDDGTEYVLHVFNDQGSIDHLEPLTGDDWGVGGDAIRYDTRLDMIRSAP